MEEFNLPKIDLEKLKSDFKTYMQRKKEIELENLNYPLTLPDNGDIIEAEENVGEADQVTEKVICPHCETEFERALLEKKNSLDKCPICHKWFLDSITCSSCKTTFKRDFIESLENKEICPMCKKRWDEKTEADLENEILAQADDVIQAYEYIEATEKCPGRYELICRKCKGNSILGEASSIWDDEVEFKTEAYIKLNPEIQIECLACGHKVTSGVVKVNIEKPIENSYTYVPKCPHCHSTLIEKISASSKLVKAAAFGAFAIPEVGKQWKCKICGHKW